MAEETEGLTATVEPTARKAPARRRRAEPVGDQGVPVQDAETEAAIVGTVPDAEPTAAVPEQETGPDLPDRARETQAAEPTPPPASDGRGARKSPPQRKPVQIDEVRRVGARIKVRRGEVWSNVVPLGDGPRFEERGGLTFLLGQYRLVRTEAPRPQSSVIEGEGELPEEALRSPRAWLHQAKKRRRIFKVQPFGLESLRVGPGGAEPTLVCQIGIYRGLLPMRLADTGAPGPERASAILGGWLTSALPLLVMVEQIDDDQQIVVLSRQAARALLARHRLQAGSRAQLVVRQVFPDRLVGDIGAGTDAWLYAREWDGLPHTDLRKLAEPGDGFEVEVLLGSPDAYTVSRERIVGDQWVSRTEAYHKFGVYRGSVGARTASGERWHVALAEGVDVVCAAPLAMHGGLAAGKAVNIRVTERDAERKQLYGAILPVR